jgi:hypothetical protein
MTFSASRSLRVVTLIRVAVIQDVGQAMPIYGTFVGAPGEYLGITVDVSVVSE